MTKITRKEGAPGYLYGFEGRDHIVASLTMAIELKQTIGSLEPGVRFVLSPARQDFLWKCLDETEKQLRGLLQIEIAQEKHSDG